MAEITTGDEVRLHYQLEGREDGPPLLFSNSLGTNLGMWDRQAAEAAGLGFRVIRYDQRGHGQSATPPGNATIERLGRDVLELLDALDIEKTAYCGLSLGGMTGIWLGMHHSRRFSRMAICNASVWMPPREMWDGRIQTVSERGMEAIVEAVLERWFTPGFRETNTDEVERVRAMFLGVDPAGYSACCAAVRDMDLRDRLGLIEAPVLVVVGARDPATTPDQARYIVERVPGAQKEVLESAHLSNIERPDDFNRVVLGFLAGERK